MATCDGAAEIYFYLGIGSSRVNTDIKSGKVEGVVTKALSGSIAVAAFTNNRWRQVDCL